MSRRCSQLREIVGSPTVVNVGHIGVLVRVPDRHFVYTATTNIVTTCIASYTKVIAVKLPRPPVVTMSVHKAWGCAVDVDIEAAIVVRYVARGSTCSSTVVGDYDVVPVTSGECLISSCTTNVVVTRAISEPKFT